MLWEYYKARTDLFDGRPKRLLHIAPEYCFTGRFKKIDNLEYISGDLSPEEAMLEMDITRIELPDNYFNIILCSHVLEHVSNDTKAISELFRILKPGGWAILMVPIKGEITIEDPSITSPEERERVFGHHDHVRQYGKDCIQRLENAGFNVTVESFYLEIDNTVKSRLGIIEEDIYYCKKQITK